MDERTRAWIYRVATALLPLLILYGVVSEAEAALWVGVLAAVLAVGEGALASKHTSTKRKDGK
jgi:hypothetical protein